MPLLKSGKLEKIAVHDEWLVRGVAQEFREARHERITELAKVSTILHLLSENVS